METEIKNSKKTKKTVDSLISELSEKLKEYRENNKFDRRLGIEGIAKNAGVSTPMIRELESGKVGNISLNKVIDIAFSIGYEVELKLKKL